MEFSLIRSEINTDFMIKLLWLAYDDLLIYMYYMTSYELVGAKFVYQYKTT